MKAGTKKILNFAFIFGTLAIVLLVGVNEQEMSGAVEALRSIGPKWIILCALTYFACLFFDSMSLHYFLRRQGQHIPFKSSVFITAVGAYYANITPGASGGQPMQVYYLAKRGIPVGISTSALTVKFFCFQFMLAVLGTVLWIVHGPFIHEQVGGYMWILIVGYAYNCFSVVMLVLIALNKKIIWQLMRLCIWLGMKVRLVKDPDGTRQKWREVLDTFHDSVTMVTKRPLDLLAQLALAGLQLLSLMTVIFFVYHAFGLSGVGYWQLVTLGLMLYTSAAYTPLPGASGAQEGVFALYFSKAFPDGIRIMALLLWRFFTYYMVLIVGAILTIWQGFKGNKPKVD